MANESIISDAYDRAIPVTGPLTKDQLRELLLSDVIKPTKIKSAIGDDDTKTLKQLKEVTKLLKELVGEDISDEIKKNTKALEQTKEESEKLRKEAKAKPTVRDAATGPSSALNGLSNIVPQVSEGFKNITSASAKLVEVTNIAGRATGTIARGLSQSFAQLKVEFAGFGRLADNIGEKWSKSSEWVRNQWGAASNWVGEQWGAASKWAGEQWGGVSKWVGEQWGGISKAVGEQWGGVSKAVSEQWGNASKWVGEQWGKVTNVVGPPFKKAAESIGQASGWAFEKIANLGGKIGRIARPTLDATSAAVNELKTEIPKVFEDPTKSLTEAARQVAENGFEPKAEGIQPMEGAEPTKQAEAVIPATQEDMAVQPGSVCQCVAQAVNSLKRLIIGQSRGGGGFGAKNISKDDIKTLVKEMQFSSMIHEKYQDILRKRGEGAGKEKGEGAGIKGPGGGFGEWRRMSLYRIAQAGAQLAAGQQSLTEMISTMQYEFAQLPSLVLDGLLGAVGKMTKIITWPFAKAAKMVGGYFGKSLSKGIGSYARTQKRFFLQVEKGLVKAGYTSWAKVVRFMNKGFNKVLKKMQGGASVLGSIFGKVFNTFGNLLSAFGVRAGALLEQLSLLFIRPLIQEVKYFQEIREMAFETEAIGMGEGAEVQTREQTRAMLQRGVPFMPQTKMEGTPEQVRVAGRMIDIAAGKDSTAIVDKMAVGMSLIEETGQSMSTIQKTQLKLWKQGIRVNKGLNKVVGIGLNLARMTNASVEGTAEFFADMHQSLRLDVIQLAEVGRGMRMIARETGITGDNLLKIAQASKKFMQNMKQAGTYTAVSGKNMMRLMAEASKTGTSEGMQAVLGVLSGSTLAGEGAAGPRQLMMEATGGRGDLTRKVLAGTVTTDKGAMKDIAQGMENVLMRFTRGKRVEDLDPQTRGMISGLMKKIYGVQLEELQVIIGNFRDASKSFAERMDALNQMADTQANREQKRQVISDKQMEYLSLFNKALKTEQGDFGAAMRRFTAETTDLPGTLKAMGTEFDAGGEFMNEMMRKAAQDVEAQLKKVGIADKAGIKEDLAALMAGVGKEGAIDPQKRQAALELIGELQRKAAAQAKALTNPVSRIEMDVKKIEGYLRERARGLLTTFSPIIQEIMNSVEGADWFKALQSGEPLGEVFKKLETWFREDLGKKFKDLGKIFDVLDFNKMIDPAVAAWGKFIAKVAGAIHSIMVVVYDLIASIVKVILKIKEWIVENTNLMETFSLSNMTQALEVFTEYVVKSTPEAVAGWNRVMEENRRQISETSNLMDKGLKRSGVEFANMIVELNRFGFALLRLDFSTAIDALWEYAKSTTFMWQGIGELIIGLIWEALWQGAKALLGAFGIDVVYEDLLRGFEVIGDFFADIGTFFVDLWDGIIAIPGNIIDAIASAATAVWDFILNIPSMLREGLVQAIRGITVVIGASILGIYAGFMAVVDFVAGIPQMAINAWNTFTTNLMAGFAVIIDFIANIPQMAIDAWNTFTTNLMAGFGVIIDFIVSIPQMAINAWDTFTTNLMAGIAVISDYFAGLGQTIMDGFQAVVKFFLELPTTIIDAITNGLKSLGGIVVEGITAGLGDLKGMFDLDIDLDAISKEMQAFWDGAVDIALAAPRAIADGFKWLYNLLFGNSIITGEGSIIEGIKNAFSTVVDWFTVLPGEIISELSTELGTKAVEIGKDFWNMIKGAFDSLGLGNIAAGIEQSFNDALRGLGYIQDWFNFFPTRVIKGVRYLIQDLIDAFKEFTVMVMDFMFDQLRSVPLFETLATKEMIGMMDDVKGMRGTFRKGRETERALERVGGEKRLLDPKTGKWIKDTEKAFGIMSKHLIATGQVTAADAASVMERLKGMKTIQEREEFVAKEMKRLRDTTYTKKGWKTAERGAIAFTKLQIALEELGRKGVDPAAQAARDAADAHKKAEQESLARVGGEKALFDPEAGKSGQWKAPGRAIPIMIENLKKSGQIQVDMATKEALRQKDAAQIEALLVAEQKKAAAAYHVSWVEGEKAAKALGALQLAAEQVMAKRAKTEEVVIPKKALGTSRVTMGGLIEAHAGEAILTKGLAEKLFSYQDAGPMGAPTDAPTITTAMQYLANSIMGLAEPLRGPTRVETAPMAKGDIEDEIKKRDAETTQKSEIISPELESVDENTHESAKTLHVVAKLLNDIRGQLASRGRRRRGAGEDPGEFDANDPFFDDPIKTEWPNGRYGRLAGIEFDITDF